MSTSTILQAIFPNINITLRKKGVICVLFAVAGSIIALWATGDFILRFSQFLELLLFMLIPWTCINLVDFYIIRKGKYNVMEFFKPDGMYKRINWGTMIVYFGTALIQVPFMRSSLYIGSVSRHVGDADLSWIVGGVVASIAYYIYGKLFIKDEVVESNPAEPEIVANP